MSIKKRAKIVEKFNNPSVSAPELETKTLSDDNSEISFLTCPLEKTKKKT